MDRQNKKCSCSRKSERRKKNARTDKEEEKKLAGSLVNTFRSHCGLCSQCRANLSGRTMGYARSDIEKFTVNTAREIKAYRLFYIVAGCFS